jgi:hypothetical protein
LNGPNGIPGPIKVRFGALENWSTRSLSSVSLEHWNTLYDLQLSTMAISLHESRRPAQTVRKLHIQEQQRNTFAAQRTRSRYASLASWYLFWYAKKPVTSSHTALLHRDRILHAALACRKARLGLVMHHFHCMQCRHARHASSRFEWDDQSSIASCK